MTSGKRKVQRKIPKRKIVFFKSHPATAEPAGTENGEIGVIAGLTMTVPSTNGANPGRNLKTNQSEKEVELKTARYHFWMVEKK